MKLKMMLALCMFSMIWPAVSEAGWRSRWVCTTGTVTGGDSNSVSTDCGWEPYWEDEGEGDGGPGGPDPGGPGGGPIAGSPAVVPVPALPTSEPVTCDSTEETKVGNAQHVAGSLGWRPWGAHAGRELTIRWSTGAIETYVNTGRPGTGWMVPVANSCIPPRG